MLTKAEGWLRIAEINLPSFQPPASSLSPAWSHVQ